MKKNKYIHFTHNTLSENPTFDHDEIKWHVEIHEARGQVRDGITNGGQFPVQHSNHLRSGRVENQVVQPK